MVLFQKIMWFQITQSTLYLLLNWRCVSLHIPVSKSDMDMSMIMKGLCDQLYYVYITLSFVSSELLTYLNVCVNNLFLIHPSITSIFLYLPYKSWYFPFPPSWENSRNKHCTHFSQYTKYVHTKYQRRTTLWKNSKWILLHNKVE